MTDGRWAVVWKIYSELREKSESERSVAFVSDSLTPEVRDEVLALLEQSTFVSQSIFDLETDATEPEYLPGTEFGRYVIVGLIGQGGFGRVYAAHDTDLRRSVAIKILSSEPASAGERILEEARSASALNHPNILTIHETIAIGGHPAMVMEFVQGQSLRKELQTLAGPLPIERAIRYGGQIAQALDAAHAAGIAHHDVKPENILVRPDGYVKLVDFGLATVIAPGMPDGPHTFTGTLRYTAPELLCGKASTPRSDIFSFGLVLYEMFTGVHPFRGETPLDTAEAIAAESALPPSRLSTSVPESLDRFILAMLSKDPERRPSAREVADALAKLPVRRRSARLLAIAAVGAVATIAAFGVWQPWTRHSPPELRLKATPLTGNEGRERRPSISPNGKYVVYEWQERLDAPAKTQVREIDTEITTTLPIQGPFTWVPGTERIGFFRKTADGDTLLTMSRQGGAEEKVLVAKDLVQAAWSPDRKFIAYIARGGDEGRGALYLYTPATGQHKQLTNPPGAPAEQYFAISPDGRQVAILRGSGVENSDIFISDFPQVSEWRQLSFNHSAGEAVTWLRDGSAVVASTFRGTNYSLWLYPARSPFAPTRLTSVGLDAFMVQAAAEMNRLVWLNALDDTNIWRMPAAGGQPVRVVASLMRDADVGVAGSGTLAFRSDRSGYPEIWISGPNGENQKRVTSLQGFTGSPRWSPDGRRIAFDSRRANANPDVFVVDCSAGLQCQEPVRMTDHPAIDALPNWSRDGNFLYFASRRSGPWQLWRIDTRGAAGSPEEITKDGGFFATESVDRKWLYYSRVDSAASTGIWRKPLSSKFPFDSPGEMLLPLEYRSTATWGLCGNEIFYQTLRPLGQPTEIFAFDVDTRKARLVLREKASPIARGLAVSADCKTVYFSRTDRSESNVVYADYDLVK